MPRWNFFPAISDNARRRVKSLGPTLEFAFTSRPTIFTCVVLDHYVDLLIGLGSKMSFYRHVLLCRNAPVPEKTVEVSWHQFHSCPVFVMMPDVSHWCLSVASLFICCHIALAVTNRRLCRLYV